jgi:hypothetical protein
MDIRQKEIKRKDERKGKKTKEREKAKTVNRGTQVEKNSERTGKI